MALATAVPVTRRLSLGTGVVLVAQHDPVVLAKQVATLDHLSGGRAVLGIGFGWNREEAADHGVDFGARRRVARDHVRCMRALWADDQAEYHGKFVDLDPCYSWPKPVRGRVPVLLGGAAPPGNFAAIAEYGDGWMPIGGSGLAEAIPAPSGVRACRTGPRGRTGAALRDGTHRGQARALRRPGRGRGGAAGPGGDRSSVLTVLDAHAASSSVSGRPWREEARRRRAPAPRGARGVAADARSWPPQCAGSCS